MRKENKKIETKIADTGKYRLSGRHLLLTYRNVPKELDSYACMRQLKKHLTEKVTGETLVESYAISWKECGRGKMGYSCYLKLKKRCDIRKSEKLDLEWENKKYKGNYIACGRYGNAVGEILKEGLDNVRSDFEMPSGEVLRPLWARCREMNKDVVGAIKLINKVRLRAYELQNLKLEEGLRSLIAETKQK